MTAEVENLLSKSISNSSLIIDMMNEFFLRTEWTVGHINYEPSVSYFHVVNNYARRQIEVYQDRKYQTTSAKPVTAEMRMADQPFDPNEDWSKYLITREEFELLWENDFQLTARDKDFLIDKELFIRREHVLFGEPVVYYVHYKNYRAEREIMVGLERKLKVTKENPESGELTLTEDAFEIDTPYRRPEHFITCEEFERVWEEDSLLTERDREYVTSNELFLNIKSALHNNVVDYYIHYKKYGYKSYRAERQVLVCEGKSLKVDRENPETGVLILTEKSFGVGVPQMENRLVITREEFEEVWNKEMPRYMPKCIDPRIGDIYCEEIDGKYKIYFQYIAKDITEENSDVIRVFKRRYPLRYKPTLSEIIKSEVEFYAHTRINFGIEIKEWYKVRRSLKIGRKQIKSIIFANALEWRTERKIPVEKLNPHENWYIWRINEPRVFVGHFPEEYRGKLESGNIRPYSAIRQRIKNGFYLSEKVLDQIIRGIPRRNVETYVRIQDENEIVYLQFIGDEVEREIIETENNCIKLSSEAPEEGGYKIYRVKFSDSFWEEFEFISKDEFYELWNKENI